MELAEGDLGELLLKSNDLHPVMFQDKIRLFKKLLGLAKGLELLHERISDPDSDSDCKMVGVHVDFRPQNILIVKDDYGDIIFKITDFGISFLGRGSSEGASFTNPRQGGDCDCRPPEGWSKILRVTTAYDVFAFGAVLCMCLAWLWGGKEEYEKFDAQRFNTLSQELNVYPNSWFFTVHPDSTYAREEMALVESKKLHLKLNTSERGDAVVIQLNERVVEYFKAIRDGDDQSDESAFIWEAFSILETHCLVPNPEQRSAMGKVHDLLNKLVERYARH
jgi:serine/threonine protein kinase